MSALDFLLPWDSQPQEVTDLSGIAARSDIFFERGELSGRVGPGELIPNGAPLLASTPYGKGRVFASNTDSLATSNFPVLPDGTEYTYLVVFHRISASGDIDFIINGDNSNRAFQCRLESSGAFGFSAFNTSVSNFGAVGTVVPVGVMHCAVVTVRSSGIKIFQLGRHTATSSAITGTIKGQSANDIGIGNRLGQYLRGSIGLFARWSFALDDDTASALSEQPFGTLFAPRTIPVPVSAGGGTTISGNLGTAVASGHTGNVNANRTIAGALGTASASGLQGNVNANRTIAGAFGVATASGLAGNVNANRTIAGSLGVAVASGLQGAVSNSNNTVIAGNLGVAVASGLAANVNANTTIAGNIGVAVASGFSGSVLNGGGQPELQHHGAWGAPLSQDKLRQMELESEAEMIEIIAMLCGAGVIA